MIAWLRKRWAAYWSRDARAKRHMAAANRSIDRALKLRRGT
jgi:hypothetical protein